MYSKKYKRANGTYFRVDRTFSFLSNVIFHCFRPEGPFPKGVSPGNTEPQYEKTSTNTCIIVVLILSARPVNVSIDTKHDGEGAAKGGRCWAMSFPRVALL